MVGETTNVIAHWTRHYEGLQCSPGAFYGAVEAALERRRIPQAVITRIELPEHRVFSARREYLRVARKHLAFEICGAPFGNGFFFSSRLIGPEPWSWPRVLLYFPVIFVSCFFYLLLEVVVAVVGGRGGPIFPKDTVLSIPHIGSIFDSLFPPEGYYEADTAAIFRALVERAVEEAIEEMTTVQGLRERADAAGAIRKITR